MQAAQFKVLSDKGPAETDERQTQDLLTFLHKLNLYETKEEAVRREEVLSQLLQVCIKWVDQIAILTNQPFLDESEYPEACGQVPSNSLSFGSEGVSTSKIMLCTFGSFRMGVHSPGADIDTLIVAPRYVERDIHFFGSEAFSLEQILKKLEGIQEVQAVPEAYVPVLKLKLHGISIDLLFSSLGMTVIPSSLNLKSDVILRHLEDDKGVRSINGARNTDEVLTCVTRIDSFRVALKLLKKWAQNRGVYSNVFGFMGGINLAIMLAKVCQFYPNAVASTVLLKFFRVFSQWDWHIPVLLRDIVADNPFGFQQWDSRYSHRDKQHLMPVITPCYPCINSMANVIETTHDIMLKEFKRGEEICLRILQQNQTQEDGEEKTTETDWAQLIEPFQFFHEFTNFLQIRVKAGSEEELQLWAGYVHSKIRNFALDAHAFLEVRPWPVEITPPISPSSPERSKEYYIGINIRQLQHSIKKSNQNSNQNSNKFQVNLTYPVKRFYDLIQQFRQKKNTMELVIQHVRRADLPDYCFEEGRNPYQDQGEVGAQRAAARIGPYGGVHMQQPTQESNTGGLSSQKRTRQEGVTPLKKQKTSSQK